MKAQKLAFLALALALAFALNLVEKSFLSFGWLNGGSIMLSIIPLLIVGIRYGFKTGLLIGAVYGMLTLFFGGFVVHPIQLLLDYILSFAMLGLVGLVARDWQDSRGIILGTILACVAMLVSFVLSGAVFFAEYAPVGQSAWVYSLIYNATYMVPTLIIAVIVTPLLGSRLAKILIQN
ncbi:MAG: energy-coupled thiamine transporter ThiT [Culicoidibacterales bacterium]